MKDVVGFDEYVVTEYGDVFRKGKSKKLKADANSSGYLRVTLCQGGVATRHFIHRIVAEAFIPNPDNLPVVNHKDGNRRNNTVENLEWCTCSENVRDGFRRGRRNSNRFSEETELMVYVAATCGIFTQKEVARDFGIHRDTVRQIVNRLTESKVQRLSKG